MSKRVVRASKMSKMLKAAIEGEKYHVGLQMKNSPDKGKEHANAKKHFRHAQRTAKRPVWLEQGEQRK